MKKILNSFLILSIVAIAGTGCLKDKGFENGTYGINLEQANNTNAVGFPEGKNAINAKGLNFVTTPQTISDPVVSLFTDQPAPIDLHVHVTANPAIVAAYNTAHGTDLVALDPALYNIPSMVVTIPAGQRFGKMTINVPNAKLLSLTEQYGFGFTITSVDEPGYNIASNLKDILIVVNVKNRYDGNYKLTINTTGWGAYGIADDNVDRQWPVSGGTSIFLITTSADEVDFWDDWGFGTYIQVAFTTGGAAATGFGATSPRFKFDLATNKLISVTNTTPPDSRNRVFVINNDPAAKNYFDPATRTIYADYFLKQSGRPDQRIIEKLQYLSDRP